MSQNIDQQALKILTDKLLKEKRYKCSEFNTQCIAVILLSENQIATTTFIAQTLGTSTAGVYAGLSRARYDGIVEDSKEGCDASNPLQWSMAPEVYLLAQKHYAGNDLLFWRKGGKGYTTNIDEAEHFLRDGLDSTLKTGKYNAWKLSDLDKLASRTVDMQKVDFTKAIKPA